MVLAESIDKNIILNKANEARKQESLVHFYLRNEKFEHVRCCLDKGFKFFDSERNLLGTVYSRFFAYL